MRQSGMARATARTAGFDVFATGLAAFISMLIAAVLGATGRGEYAAIMAWFGLVLMAGEVGQTSATCYFASREPHRAADWLATSRALMLVSGAATVVVGLVLAHLLGGGREDLTWSYRIAFVVCAINYIAMCYLGGLQARAMSRWNVARTAQSVFFLAGVLALMLTDSMSVPNTMLAFAAAVAAYTVLTYALSATSGLAGGAVRTSMVAPLLRFGSTQMAALAPLAVNSRLDQIVLAQVVPAADLGRYAVAVGLASLAVPFAGAIGHVAFPRLASTTPIPGGAARFQRRALLSSAAVSCVVLLPICVFAPSLIQWFLGDDFRGSAEIMWVLAPGGVFLSCGYVAGNLLKGRGRPGHVARAYIVGSVVMVVALFGLLNQLGVLAAALASSIGYLTSFGMMASRLRRLSDKSGPGSRDGECGRLTSRRRRT